jgi:hypothetical protein
MNRVIRYLYGDQNVASVTSDKELNEVDGTFGMLSTAWIP